MRFAQLPSCLLATVLLWVLFASGVKCQIDQVRTQMLQLLQVSGSVVDANITEWLSIVRADGSFADINYTDPNIAWWPACYHTRRMWTISAAHASPSSIYYNTSVSLRSALVTFDFWLRNDFQNANWWYNDIGVPQAVGPTMLLLQQYALPNQTQAALTILSRASASGGTDANAVWEEAVQCYAAVITKNATALGRATSLLWSAISLQSAWAPSDTGMKPDKSFWMHGSQFYSGGYGHMYAATLLTAVAWAAGTTFEPPQAATELLVDFLVDGSLQMIRYSNAAPAPYGAAMWDINTIGREISRPYGMDWNSGAGQTVSFQGAALEAIAQATSYRVSDLRQFSALLNGSSPSPALAVNTGFRYYPFSAYGVFSSPSYLMSLRMASNVTQTVESINGENCQGIHLSDGAMYIYQSGYEFANIFPAWDWQKIPGTTVAPYAVKDACGSWGSTLLPQTAFVGGTSDGARGVVAMDFHAPFGQGLSLRRSVAVFDDLFVVLGANLTNFPPQGAPSLSAHAWTTIQQRTLTTNVFSSTQGAAAPWPTGGNYSLALDDWWVWEGGVGYILLDRIPGAKMTSKLPLACFSNMVQTGNWEQIGAEEGSVSASMFTFWLEHQNSSSPLGDTFAYAVLPGIPLDTFVVNLNATLEAVVVIENSPKLQAVKYDNPLSPGTLVATVFSPIPGGTEINIPGGESWNITVDHAGTYVFVDHAAQQQFLIAAANPIVNQEWQTRVRIDRQFVASASGCLQSNTTSEWSAQLLNPATNGSTTSLLCQMIS